MVLAILLVGCYEDAAPPAGDATLVDAPVQGDVISGGDCTTDTDCDDSVSCTVDTCANGACQWEIASDVCFINGACREVGDISGCNTCAPTLSPTGWSPAPNGTVCEDSEPCTDVGFCASGMCQTEPSSCDDKNDCTADSCDPTAGCVHTLESSGTPCSTGSACYLEGSCADGSCGAAPITCDDDNECTVDTCDASEGCLHGATEGVCDDGDACTGPGACNGGTCESGEALDCDDGNMCTKDSCHSAQGCTTLETFSPCCTGAVSVCDDGNPCTTDLCDPATKDCAYENNYLLCNDGDACTTSDSCAGGTCEGDAVDCSDGNECTSDPCSPVSGCSHVPLTGAACDDGLECSTGDTCDSGDCAGDTSQCVCVPDFSDTVAKLVYVALGDGGYVGEGLDVDGDPATCAPEDSCAGGINNAFSALSAITEELAGVDINDEMAKNTTAGWVKLVAELRNYGSEDFALAIYQADLDPANNGCDFQKNVCSYWVQSEFLDDETCLPKALLPATLNGTSILAGGPGTSLPFDLPFEGGVTLEIVLYNLMFEGQVSVTNGSVNSFSGILGGAIPKADLEAAILKLPPEALGGFEAADVMPLLSLALEYDINVPGKGPSASIGLKLEGIGASITGVAP